MAIVKLKCPMIPHLQGEFQANAAQKKSETVRLLEMVVLNVSLIASTILGAWQLFFSRTAHCSRLSRKRRLLPAVIFGISQTRMNIDRHTFDPIHVTGYPSGGSVVDNTVRAFVASCSFRYQ